MTSWRSVVGFVAGLLLAVGGAGAEVEVVDFAKLPAGTIVDHVFGNRGTGPIKVDGFNARFGPGVNAAVIFDTANPTGEDLDLGAPNETFGTEESPLPGKGRGGVRGAPFENAEPLGKLLILAEDLEDLDGDGLVDDPDDEGKFRQLRFTLDFSEVGPVTLHRMTLIDVEDQEKTPTVQLLDAGGNAIFSLNLPITDDNGVVRVDLGPTEGVSKMVVELHGSGAISSLRFEKPGPRIDIEKLTNGSQADSPTDADVPFVLIGQPVNWSYRVANTGTEQLQNVTVTDDRGESVSCPGDTLEPGESMECTASGVALDLTAGDLGFEPVTGVCRGSGNRRLYANTGSVEAVGTISEQSVYDSDPSHYCSAVPVPGIYVRKQRKGPDSRAIPIGTQATFEIFVKNTGAITLTDVKVADVLAPDCNREFDSLGPGQSRRYECAAPALTGGADSCSLVNEVVATGMGDGRSVTDSDTSTIEALGLAIDKQFKSVDARGAVFQITVTNNGCDLDSVEASDELAPDCRRSLGAMAAGDTQTYECTMPLENEACAEGKRGDGSVSACDTAAFTIEPGGKNGDKPVPDPIDKPGDGEKPGDVAEKKSSNLLLLLALALLVGGGLFAWNRMKAG